MEMWCPDDTGRDSFLTTKGGSGLGRLLGGEHVSTPQSGVEAPRLSPDCIIVVVVACASVVCGGGSDTVLM